MRRVLAGLVLAPLVLTAVAFAQAAGPDVTGTIDASRFAAEIQALADAVRNGEAGSVAEIRHRVPTVWSVRTGEQTVNVPGAWLQQRLDDARNNPQSWPSTRLDLLNRLQIAEVEARALDQRATTVDTATARTSLEQVLARPEFAQMARETALSRLQARVLEWLRDWWERLGGDRLAVRSTATVFAWIVSLTALAVLASWLTHMLRRSAPVPHPTVEAVGRRISARAWAQRAAAAEDLREAARCAYRAVVSRLEEDGTWRADDARTPREYLGLLPRIHARRPILEDVARRFEEIWFGGRTPTADDRGSILRHLKELGCLPAE